MIRSDIRLRCESRIRDLDNEIVDDAEWNDYIADAEREVLTASPWWPWNEARNASVTVTAGSTSTALPTDCWRVNAVLSVTDHYPLQPMSGRGDYQWTWSDPDGDTGNPTHYRVFGENLEVFPRPASDITLRLEYMAAPQLMTNDSASPVWPAAYHDILVYGAMSRFYEDDGNANQAALHQARFDKALARMQDDLLPSRLESYHQIADDWLW